MDPPVSLHVCSSHRLHMDPPVSLHVCPSHKPHMDSLVSLHVCSSHRPVTPRPLLGPGGVTPGSLIGYLDWPHRPTLVFSVHFVLTRAHPVTHFPVGHPS